MAKSFTLKSGLVLPPFGFGTWRLGEDPSAQTTEIAAVRHAIDIGFNHLDTAEMYGDGATEDLLGRAISGIDRDRLILTSKVYPWNAGVGDMVAACEASLDRLGTDYLDLYLLHWPGSVPFEDTLEGAARLKSAGKIRAFGVSNFDARTLARLSEAGLDQTIEVNQVMHNPSRRGIEYDLLPAMDAANIHCVAYTPIEPARLSRSSAFNAVAQDLGLDVAGLAMAWHVSRGAAIPIPKASTIPHVDQLRAAVDAHLDAETLARIDAAFPPPTSPLPLDIL